MWNQIQVNLTLVSKWVICSFVWVWTDRGDKGKPPPLLLQFPQLLTIAAVGSYSMWVKGADVPAKGTYIIPTASKTQGWFKLWKVVWSLRAPRAQWSRGEVSWTLQVSPETCSATSANSMNATRIKSRLTPEYSSAKANLTPVQPKSGSVSKLFVTYHDIC